jgi:hypothetical protein
VARAKQTNRAEARKRYRQATQPGDPELDEQVETDVEPAPNQRANVRPAPAKGASQAKSAATAPARPGFMTAFRSAYHQAHPREDLRYLPGLLLHWSFLASVVLIIASTIAYALLPNYTGTAFLLQLVVWPGQALAPQVIAGLFAQRASYMLGFLLGIFQGIAFTILVGSIVTLNTSVQPEQLGGFIVQWLLAAPVIGALYAAAAAWYRRFLRESSPRRAQQGGKPGAKPTPKRSTARR